MTPLLIAGLLLGAPAPKPSAADAIYPARLLTLEVDGARCHLRQRAFAASIETTTLLTIDGACPAQVLIDPARHRTITVEGDAVVEHTDGGATKTLAPLPHREAQLTLTATALVAAWIDTGVQELDDKKTKKKALLLGARRFELGNDLPTWGLPGIAIVASLDATSTSTTTTTPSTPSMTTTSEDAPAGTREARLKRLRETRRAEREAKRGVKVSSSSAPSSSTTMHGVWKEIDAAPTMASAGETPGLSVVAAALPTSADGVIDLDDVLQTQICASGALTCSGAPKGAATAVRAALSPQARDNVADVGVIVVGGVPFSFPVMFGDTPHAVGPLLRCTDAGCQHTAIVVANTGSHPPQLALSTQGRLLLVAEEYSGAAPKVFDAQGKQLLTLPTATMAVWRPAAP